MAIQFAPKKSGNLTEGVTLTDDALNVAGATQQISVSGGAPPFGTVLTSPTTVSGVGGVLPSSKVFTWSAGTGVAYYDLHVGTGGVGSYNLYNIQHTTALSSSALTIPSQGKTVYVRLSSDIAGIWTNVDYIFTESAAVSAALGLRRGACWEPRERSRGRRAREWRTTISTSARPLRVRTTSPTFSTQVR